MEGEREDSKLPRDQPLCYFPGSSAKALGPTTGEKHKILWELSPIHLCLCFKEPGQDEGHCQQRVTPPDLQAWAKRDEADGDTCLEAHSMKS